MAINKLTDLKIKKDLKKRGIYADGGNLYLQVGDEPSHKSWIFRYKRNNVTSKMGLGAYPALTLEKARKEAAKWREAIALGQDPKKARDSETEQKRISEALSKAKTKTFAWCAEQYYEAHKDGWSNEKHKWQWLNSLKKYVYPSLGGLPVSEIDAAMMEQTLKPVWKSHNETATRIRPRIEAVLDWAKIRGYRDGENPARWRNNLDKMLPKPSKVHKVIHQPSLHYSEVNEFWEALSKLNGLAPQALRVLILTAVRTSELLYSTWDEVDLRNAVLTIPAERTKTKQNELRVPLSKPVLKILEELKKTQSNKFIFPGRAKDTPLSNMTMLVLIRRMNEAEKRPKWIDSQTKEPIVPHGFRSTFRMWVSEVSNAQSEVAEAALGHKLGSNVFVAYQRGDLLDKRRQLMNTWAQFVQTPYKVGGDNVRKLRA